MRVLILTTMLFVPLWVSGQETFEAKNGTIYQKGDTLYPSAPYDGNEYATIFNMKGLTLEKFGNEINGIPLIVTGITKNRLYNKDGDYTYLKGKFINGGRATVVIQSAIDMCEIDNCEVYSPPRVIPEGYTQFSFQGSFWDDAMSVVKERNGPPDAAQENALTYKTTVGTLDALLIYYFHDNKLYQVIYSFTEEHSEDQRFVEDYKYINSLLTEKYGQGDYKQRWINDLYQGEYNDMGRAVSAGHLTLITKWELPDTDIHQSLDGDNFKILHLLGYSKYPKVDIPKEKPLGKL